nr:AlpA family phage regulatory protein [Roseomonas rosea]
MDRLLRLDQVIETTGLSASTIYKWQAEDRFPRAVLLGPRATRWVASEVAAWVDQQKELGARASFTRPAGADRANVKEDPRPGAPAQRRRGRPRAQ